MKIESKFELGQEIETDNGIKGKIESISRSRGMNVNRLSIEYVSEKGEILTIWIDEDRVMDIKCDKSD